MKERKVKKKITVEGLQKTVEDLLKRDGFLVPVIFVLDKEAANIIDVQEFMESDRGKDNLVAVLTDYIKEKEAYKVIMVSEIWAYKAPSGMTREQIDEVIAIGKHRHEFDKEEMYQIIEIRADGIKMLTRSFYKEEEEILFDEKSITSDGVELVRFKPIQDALIDIN